MPPPSEEYGASLPEDGGVHGEAGTETMDPEQEMPDDKPVEKYSSQVLRRLHEDFSQLMEEYDEMREPLEHEPVDAVVTKVLEGLEAFLTEIEETHEEHHPDAEPLGGGGTGDEPIEEERGKGAETNAVEADSEMDREPSPDEAVRGMRGKGYKAMCSKCGKDHAKGTACKGKSMKTKGTLGVEEGHVPGTAVHHHGPGEHTDEIVEEGEHTPGEETDQFQEHEHKSLTESQSFLQEVAEGRDWTDEHRMKAYHYHKLLDHMGQLTEPGQVTGGMTTGKDFHEAHQAEETADVEMHGGAGKLGMKEARQGLGQISGWLHNLSGLPNIGGEHRQQAAAHHKMISGILDSHFGASNEATGDVNMETPSGQASVKALKETYAKQSEAITALNRKIAALAGGPRSNGI